MRVEHGDPFAVAHVLDDKIEKQRRLPGSRGADDVSVPSALVRAERHNGSLSRMLILAEHEAVATRERGRRLGLLLFAFELRRPNRGRGEMDQ